MGHLARITSPIMRPLTIGDPVMSENPTSKKPSFLTRAMQAVEAKKAEMASDKGEPTSEEAAGKQALKKFALVTAGTIAATVATIVLINKLSAEDDEDGFEQETDDTDETPTEN
ncbi:hypothetical protein SEA_TIEDYE_43 [Streptomyces phage TieDye]|uniref:Uncharacterized protein n=6 Tax=Rimavirus TaxID=2560214 RepID=A0A7G9UZR4_9CAUD|nr:hypothetical protein SEA_TIEDYE_43 [Streptomyces phage TieDye]